MQALVYFALWAGLIFLVMRIGCGAHVMGHGHGRDGTHGGNVPVNPEPLRWVPPETDVDPVCGKTVHTEKAKSSIHDGAVYYFCSRECREQFEAAPQFYLGHKTDQQPKQLDHSHG